MKRLPIILLLVTASAFAQHKISVQKYEVPPYPLLGQNHVGTVLLEFKIGPQGVPYDARVINVSNPQRTGKDDVDQAAMKWASETALGEITKWKLRCEDCSKGEIPTHRFTFEFLMNGLTNCEDETAYWKRSIRAEFPNKVTFTSPTVCSYADPVEIRRPRGRSIRCLYLWRCKPVDPGN